MTAIRSKSKQAGLRDGQRLGGVIQAQVVSSGPGLRNMFFRPEEYGFASIVSDDVAGAEGMPIDIGDE
jgi:hypothetical protein